MRRSRHIIAGALLLAAVALVGCGSTPPNVSGLGLDRADSLIKAAGFTVGAVTYVESSSGATWTVIAQSPSGQLEPGHPVDLVLAGGRPASVPDVRGVSKQDAASALVATGLQLGRVAESHDASAPTSAVIAQGVTPGDIVTAGSSIDVTVSLGPEPPPSSSLRLQRIKRTTGAFSPKSVVASQNGFVFAQNMMYRHTISVFDDKTHELVKTIRDTVTLADFGYERWASPVRGAPVEAAMSPDGRYVYVSNYSMYGPGFSHPGDDVGSPASGVDRSFVYRIPLDTLKVDKVIRVGAVPKYLAVTPDGRYLLVSNWISYTVSIVDTTTNRQVRQIKLGAYPRGIAITADSRCAYVAVMGSTSIAKIDLTTFKLGWIRGVGSSPRHVVLSPDGAFLYVTLNGSGKIAKVRTATGKVVARVSTGSQPRSMAIAEDGLSLYVVNYASNTVSKVRTRDMHVLQTLRTDTHPIGITFVNATREVWVSCYRGSILVFQDR